jgi:uncharacterized repeat protein (TIGR02543 family)
MISFIMIFTVIPLNTAAEGSDEPVVPGETLTVYPLWIAGTQVTEDNVNDILNDGGKAKYDPETKTLTFNNLKISECETVIRAEDDLTVTGILTATGKTAGITADKTLTFTGDKTQIAITANNGIAVKAASIAVKSGKLTVFGNGADGNGLYAKSGNIEITGGTVESTSTGYAIYAVNNFAVSGEKTSVTASGRKPAIITEKGTIKISSPLAVTAPEGGKLGKDSKRIYESDGKTSALSVTIKKPASYTVTFNVNGHGSAPEAQTVESGSTAAKPKDLTEDGWVFGGWYSDKECTKEYDFSTPVTAAVTVFAKWTEKTYSISVLCTDGNSKPVNGAEMQLISSDGSVLSEWTSSSKPQIVENLTAGEYTIHEKNAPEGYLTASDESFAAGKDTEVVISHQIISFIIKYNVENGTWSDGKTAEKTETVEYGSKPANVPTKMKAAEGYADGEWDTDPSSAEITEEKTFTYTFKEIPKYTVTFDANGHGRAPEAQTVESGKTAAKPKDLTEDGWVFGGWYSDKEYTKEYVFSTPVTASVTVFAKWTEKTYSVNVLSVDGTSDPLEGAVLQLKKDGKVIAEWTSGPTAHTIEGLTPGIYTVCEKTAPEGYFKAGDIDFTIRGTDESVTVSHQQTKVDIYPSDETGTALSSTSPLQIQITDPEGNVAESWTSWGFHSIEKLKTGVKYTIHILKQPLDFQTKDQTFTINADGTIDYSGLNHGNTLYLIFMRAYEVKYKVENGTWSDGKTGEKTEWVIKGEKPADVPTGMKASEGYENGAWDKDPSSTEITEAKTFTYTFTEIPKFTVTFDANGHGTAPASQSVERGRTAAKPKDPTDDGWLFSGWYSDKECTEEYVFSTPVTAGITVFAKWAEITYSVTVDPTSIEFSAEEGYNAEEQQELYKEMTAASTGTGEVEFIMGGFKESSMYEQFGLIVGGMTATVYPLEGLSAGTYTAVVRITDFEDRFEEIEIPVTFTVNPAKFFTVTFDANGHGKAPDAQSVQRGKTAENPGDLTEKGWVFGGWYSDKECTKEYDFSTPVGDDITVFAKWTEKVPDVLYPVWIGSVQVNSDNKDDILNDDGNAKFDPETNTLTLNSPSVSGEHENAGIYSALDGELKITGKADVTGTVSGIYAENGLVFEDAEITATATGKDSDAIIAKNGNITVSDGNVTAASVKGCGMHATNGGVTVSGESTVVNITAGKGIDAAKDIDIQSGSVTVTATESDCISSGSGNILIADGTVVANATGEKSNGIYTQKGDITISGGDVSAAAIGERATVAIYANGGSIHISGGTVKADGEYWGIYSFKGNIDISGKDTDVTVSGQLYAVHTEKGKISVSGGKITATSQMKSFLSDTGDIDISGGTIIAKTTSDTSGVGISSLKGNINISGEDTVVTADGTRSAIQAKNGKITISDPLGIDEPTAGTLDDESHNIQTKDGEITTHAVIRKVTKYTVTFDANGHGTAPEEQKVQKGHTAQKPEDPTKDGCVFDGWYSDKECKKEYDFETPVDKDITLFAKWTTYSFTVTPSSVKITAAEGYNAEEQQDLYKDIKASSTGTGKISAVAAGFTEASMYEKFGLIVGGMTATVYPKAGLAAGTYTATVKIEDIEDRCDPVEVKVTLTVKAAPTYTVIFDGNGGTVTPSSVLTGKGGKISAAPVPKRSGYQFEGWYTAKNGGKKITKDTVFTANAVVYAHWKAVEDDNIYILTYRSDGGSAVASTVHKSGTTVKLTAVPKRAGYTFKGWYADPANIYKITSIKMTGDKTVYAGWIKNDDYSGGSNVNVQYTLTYNTKGGIALSSSKHYAGSTVKLTAVPTREGYTFDGWYSDYTLTERITSVKMTGDKTVYAGWKEDHIVVIITDGRERTEVTTVSDGGKITEPKDPKKDGYTFGGWFADQALTVPFNFSKPVTTDIAVYAKWIKNETPAPVPEKEPEAPVFYTVTSGSIGIWERDSQQTYGITVKRSEKDETCFSHFRSVEIDGDALVKGVDYDAKAGSTVITIKPSALQKIIAGAHIITVNFDDGTAAAIINITVSQSQIENPETSDDNIWIWIILAAASVVCVCAAVLLAKKKKQ